MRQKERHREKHYFKDRKRKATKAKIQRKADKYQPPSSGPHPQPQP